MEKKNRLKAFFESDASTGVLLIFATLLALIVANSSLNPAYQKWMNTEFIFGFKHLHIKESLYHWINDGLMALFFLLVGLEIKKELIFGRLQSLRSAIFPVVAACCGAIIPAIIYGFVNKGTPYANGWAIPMATDIAFVIGIIALLGSRVPVWAKVFVTTIAVVDDLIAVLVIAFFYTDHINWTALTIAGLCVLVLLYLNKKNVIKLSPYLFVGFILWWAVLVSGIHATIAGVILAFTIPLHREWGVDEIRTSIKKSFDLFNDAKAKNNIKITTEKVHKHLETTLRSMESPLHRLERKLHKAVYFVIMPLFAFVNAGIVINASALSDAFALPVTWGVVLGLFLGKQMGILIAVWVLLTFFFKDTPQNKMIWRVIYGIALLCGVGFTMSIFIANLSFNDVHILADAKIGILLGSLVSGILGYLVLRSATKHPELIDMEKLRREKND